MRRTPIRRLLIAAAATTALALGTGLAATAPALADSPASTTPTGTAAPVDDDTQPIQFDQSSMAPLAQTVPQSSGAAGSTVAYPIITNNSTPQCLDAQTQGQGVNGNVVQLYKCNGQANQYWIPLDKGGITRLENAMFRGKCLDADNSSGLKNGGRIQLYSCFDNAGAHPNQYWRFYGNDGYAHPVRNYQDVSFVLDAATQTIGKNGGKVQLYKFSGAYNQYWAE